MGLFDKIFKNDDNLYDLAVKQAKEGRFMEAMDTANEMKDGEYRSTLCFEIADITSQIAVKQAKAGDFDYAEVLLKRADFASSKARDAGIFVVDAYLELAELYKNIGDFVKAIDTIREAGCIAEEIKRSPSDFLAMTKVATNFRDIGTILMNGENFEQAKYAIGAAEYFALKIKDDVFREGELNRIINLTTELAMYEAAVGDFDQAANTAELASNTARYLQNENSCSFIMNEISKLSNSYRFTSLATREAEIGRFEKATKALEQAINIVLEINEGNEIIRGATLFEIAKKQVQIVKQQMEIGDFEEAGNTLEKATDTAINIKDGQKRSNALEIIKEMKLQLKT